MADITDMLNRWTAGDMGVSQEMLGIVYSEMKAIAHAMMIRERPGHVLGTTALVHEAYLRLVDGNRIGWRARAHFFGAAAKAMRRILVDDARRRLSAKRGGGIVPGALDHALTIASEPDLDVVALSAALDELEQVDPERARVVELRYFAGLTLEETAEMIGCSPQSVHRDWVFAKAWLARRLTPAKR